MKKTSLLLVLLLASLSVMFVSCGSDEAKAISIVKNGYFPSISETTIESGAKNIFKNHDYEAFYADDGELYVNLKGTFDSKGIAKQIAESDTLSMFLSEDDKTAFIDSYLGLMGVNPEVIYQFIVYLDNGSFDINAVTLNGEESGDPDAALLMLLNDVDSIVDSAIEEMY